MLPKKMEIEKKIKCGMKKTNFMVIKTGKDDIEKTEVEVIASRKCKRSR